MGPFPELRGSCFPPQLCFPPCSGLGNEPGAAHHPLHKDKLLETLCFPPLRVLLMEAKTCPETTELKTRCVQILIKGRSLPKQQPGEISNSTLEVAPSSVKLQKKEKGKKKKTRKPKPAAKNTLHNVSEWGSNRAQAGDSKTSEGQGGTLNFHFLLLPSASLWCKPTTDTHLLS